MMPELKKLPLRYEELSKEEQEYFRSIYDHLGDEITTFITERREAVFFLLILFGALIGSSGSLGFLPAMLFPLTALMVLKFIDQPDSKVGDNSAERATMEKAIGGKLLPFAHDYNLIQRRRSKRATYSSFRDRMI